MVEIKTLPLKTICRESFSYIHTHLRSMVIFTVIHIVLLIVGFKFLDGWYDLCFLPWLIVYYLFCCFFFRFYFKKKPYLITPKLIGTLVPSMKIFTLSFLVITLLLLLPLIPLFLGIKTDWGSAYGNYLQHYMEEDTKMMDTITVFVLLLISPFIYFRPIMAWISSLIGRSGALKTAFARTKGNYWQMFALMTIFELLFIVLKFMGDALGINDWLLIIIGSPLMIYFNLILAQTYDYFFLEIE